MEWELFRSPIPRELSLFDPYGGSRKETTHTVSLFDLTRSLSIAKKGVSPGMSVGNSQGQFFFFFF